MRPRCYWLQTRADVVNQAALAGRPVSGIGPAGRLAARVASFTKEESNPEWKTEPCGCAISSRRRFCASEATSVAIHKGNAADSRAVVTR
jgi:hypothetical protein